MVILNEHGDLKSFKSYDLFYHKSHATQLNAKLLGDSVGVKDIVLMATGDSANRYIHLAKDGIESVLCGRSLPTVALRDTLTVIGSKASPCPTWFFMEFAKAGTGPVIKEAEIIVLT